MFWKGSLKVMSNVNKRFVHCYLVYMVRCSHA